MGRGVSPVTVTTSDAPAAADIPSPARETFTSPMLGCSAMAV